MPAAIPDGNDTVSWVQTCTASTAPATGVQLEGTPAMVWVLPALAKVTSGVAVADPPGPAEVMEAKPVPENVNEVAPCAAHARSGETPVSVGGASSRSENG